MGLLTKLGILKEREYSYGEQVLVAPVPVTEFQGSITDDELERVSVSGFNYLTGYYKVLHLSSLETKVSKEYLIRLWTPKDRD